MYCVLKFQYIHLFHRLTNDFSTLLPASTKVAQFRLENGRMTLIHDGHKFIRYGSNENTRYWRCRQSFKYLCKARILTKLINGRELIEIQNEKHDHILLRFIKKEKE